MKSVKTPLGNTAGPEHSTIQPQGDLIPPFVTGPYLAPAGACSATAVGASAGMPTREALLHPLPHHPGAGLSGIGRQTVLSSEV